MALSQVRHFKVSGLQSQTSPFEAPEGALEKADNCVIEKAGVIEKRRGYSRYTTSSFIATLSWMGTLYEYKDRLHYLQISGGHLYYDSDGSGTFAETAQDELHYHISGLSFFETDERARAVEVQGNVYLNFGFGLAKKDSLTATSRRAGMPQGLDMELSLTGSAGFLSGDTKVRYRIAFQRQDANDLTIIGAPSYPQEIANPTASVTADWAGGTAIVKHTSHGLSSGDTVTISGDAEYAGTYTISVVDTDTYTYRLTTAPTDKTDVSLTASVDRNVTVKFSLPDQIIAGDQYRIFRSEMSASASTAPGDRLLEVATVDITSTDITNGTITYTDSVLESSLGAELYTNPTQETITQANYRPPCAADIAYFNGRLYFANLRTPPRVNLKLASLPDFDGDSITITDGTNTLQVTFTSGSESTSTGLAQRVTSNSTTADNIEATMRSFVRVVNRNSGSAWYAHYSSDTDDPPGMVIIEARSPDQDLMTVSASSSTLGDAFDPSITDGITADEPYRKNALMWSKFEEPEHVPEANVDFVGDRDNRIVRIVALRDALIIFKEEEGVWYLDKNDILSQMDPTVYLRFPESVAVLNNAVYAATMMGVVRVDESGVAIVSWDINRELIDELKRVNTTFSGNNRGISAVSKETDNRYILWIPGSDSSLGEPTYAYVYNWRPVGSAWTKWTFGAALSVVMRDEDKMYIVRYDDGEIYYEDDYWDTSYSATLSGTTTTTNEFGETVGQHTIDVTSNGGWDLTVGSKIVQGGNTAYVTAISGSTITVSNTDLTDGACTVYIGITSEVRWVADDADNPFVTKQFSETAVYLETDAPLYSKLGFQTNKSPTIEYVRLFRNDQSSNEITPLRTTVPESKQRALTIKPSFWTSGIDNFKLIGMSILARYIGHKITQAPRE